MSNKDIFHKYIKERTDCADFIIPSVAHGIDTVPGDVHYRLKLAIVLSELITFTSHLRKNIELYDGTIVPTNAIVFALSGSGMSKDKSLNAVRKALSPGYDLIEAEREFAAESTARKKARLESNGEGDADWRKYYRHPSPLQAGLGTAEGLVQHFSDIAKGDVGSASIMTSEIGSELQTNGYITEIIKVVSVGYDLGNIPAKIVKSKENQTPPIKNLPINALLFGSQEAILFDPQIKSKFRMMFSTQLARRSIFAFIPDGVPAVQIENISDLHKIKEAERSKILVATQKLNEKAAYLVNNTNTETLKLTEDATKLFDVYLEYNSILSEEYSNKFPISKLSAKHKQWLALKLAGTYSILSGLEHITESMYATAINTVMYLASDLELFEKELVKEPYEQFVDMCKFNADSDGYFLSIHDLRKMSYITGSGTSSSKIDELVTLANSCDPEGIYTGSSEGVRYQQSSKSSVVGVSYKLFDSDLTGENLKHYMMENSASGFCFHETTFEEIEILLRDNAAYGCFAFNNGERSKANLTGSTKFVILDIDDSAITDEEVHILLEEYNHYVVRTSDPENAFKFRVILELDAPADIDSNTWRLFIAKIGEELGFTVDVLPQSQIFFSFKDRNILKQLDGSTLSTKEILDKVSHDVKHKKPKTQSLPDKVKSSKLDNPRDTFSFAYEAENGQGSLCMFRALTYAVDLGANKDYISELAQEINTYWTCPMDQERLERTLINPVLRRL